MSVVANLLIESVSENKLKLSTIFQTYEQILSGRFFMDHSVAYIVYMLF